MQVELKAISHSIIVYPSCKSTGTRERISVKTGLHAKGAKFIRRTNGVSAASAANHQAEFRETRVEPPLQRSQDRRCDPAGMPIHTHDCTERLEPERIAQASEKLARTIFHDDVLGDGGAKLGHAVRQPRWHTAAMERKVGCS